MEKQQLLQADFLDILFDRRNKQYGSYELRKKYPDRARRAAMSVIAGALLISAIPVIASNIGSKRHGPATFNSATTERVIDVAKIKKDRPVTPTVTPPAPARIIATVRNPTYIIKPTTDVLEDAPRPVDSVGNRMIGAHDNAGHPDGLVADNGQPDGEGTKPTTEPNGVELDKPAGPVRIVEQMPEFSGNINEYLQNHLQYPELARANSKQGRVVIQFVVNEDGAITNTEVIKSVDKSLDAEAMRVVSGMPRWKPGKQNGVAVKVYYMLPVTFTLE